MLNRSASLAMSTSVLKALPGKLDIKRHSPSIPYLYRLLLDHAISTESRVLTHLINKSNKQTTDKADAFVHSKPRLNHLKFPALIHWICSFLYKGLLMVFSFLFKLI